MAKPTVQKMRYPGVGEVSPGVAVFLDLMSGSVRKKRAFVKRCAVLGQDRAEVEYALWMEAAA